MKLKIFRHIFEKYSNTKFHENTSGRSRAVPYGRTDGTNGQRNIYDETDSLYPQVRERA